MADQSSSGKDGWMMAHVPTLMLIIGYVAFWLELYGFRFPAGRTSLLATLLFIGAAVVVGFKNRFNISGSIKNFWQAWLRFDRLQKIFVLTGLLASLGILACALAASLLPPHLAQETDVLIYHITLPRQHLIGHSFAHLPWSTADLYLLPLDFALAPYWLVTSLPNKIPQFFFLLSLVALCGRLVFRFRSDHISVMLVLFAVLGSHHVGIQAGTAMLDLVMVYLLFAALDSFLRGNFILAGIELAFYVWSKSFIPIQCALIALVMISLWLMVHRRGWRLSWMPEILIQPQERLRLISVFKKTTLVFVVSSVFIAGPFVAKSLHETGSPLFPFCPGLVKTQGNVNSGSPAWQSIIEKARMARATRDQYGSGRSPMEFLKHLWLIAVPEQGVNNRYDYPVGLMYLLFVVPFLVFWIQSLRKKEFSILPLFVVVFWLTWWMGSHQTRFLLVPTVLMLVVVAAKIPKPSKALMGTMMVALLLTALSVVRANKHDWGRSPSEVLREKDRHLLAMAKTVGPGQTVELDFLDAAFAEFPITVAGSDSVFVLKQ